MITYNQLRWATGYAVAGADDSSLLKTLILMISSLLKTLILEMESRLKRMKALDLMIVT